LFRIRAVTPRLIDESGAPYALGELRVGNSSAHFLIDLTLYSIADYERQWRCALRHLMHGGRSTGLLTAYRGREGTSHKLWALWRDDESVHVQEQSVVPSDLEAPFDPAVTHLHVGNRIPATENALPMREWRIESAAVYAAALGIRWPW